MDDNMADDALNATLSQARSKLTRQTQAVKATIALIKLLEEAITDRQKAQTNTTRKG